MEAMRKAWTDERLDDMNRRMESGFSRVDADIHSLRSEMNDRFNALQRTLLQVGGGVIAALIGLIGVQLGLIVTQL
jgi:hypothetical protein